MTAELAGLSSPQEVIGKTDEELWGNQAHSLIHHDKEVITHGKTIIMEESLKTATNQWMHFTGIKMPLRDENNKIIGIIGNSLDITELKNTQEELKKSIKLAEAANHAKTEFLENMRHDIRTPLTGIVGFSDIIKIEAKDLHIKEYCDNLVASSHALLNLLDDVLEAIHISSGEIPRLRKKFSLHRTLEHIIALNQAKAAQKSLSLTLKYDPKIPNFVIGDQVRVHRIVLELITNALNFTHSGFVTLTAELARQDHHELIIELIVEDSGIGIPKEKQHEIYVQFKRLTPSFQGIYKGSGLGLFLVKQFIDELEGEIYLHSEPDKGSRFICLIPLRESLLVNDVGVDEESLESLDAVVPLFNQEENLLSSSDEGSYRILVVEDNSIAQSVAKSMLAPLNCAVDIAESGKQAVHLWKNNHYDLIFMDIGLPDLDGYEVTHRIRIQELSKKSHIPIIALTAHAGEENKRKCIEAGMNAVITKPLTYTNCADILNAFIPGRQTNITRAEPNKTQDLPTSEKVSTAIEK